MRSHLACWSDAPNRCCVGSQQYKHYHFIQMSADQGKNLSGKTVKIQDCMRYGSSMLVSLSFVGQYYRLVRFFFPVNQLELKISLPRSRHTLPLQIQAFTILIIFFILNSGSIQQRKLKAAFQYHQAGQMSINCGNFMKTYQIPTLCKQSQGLRFLSKMVLKN